MPTLSWVGSLVDSDCVLWLGLIEVGEGVKISLSNLLHYFSVSGDSKQKKNSHKKVVLWPQPWGWATLWWAPPKSTTFFDAAPKLPWRKPFTIILIFQVFGCRCDNFCDCSVLALQRQEEETRQTRVSWKSTTLLDYFSIVYNKDMNNLTDNPQGKVISLPTVNMNTWVE